MICLPIHIYEVRGRENNRMAEEDLYGSKKKYIRFKENLDELTTPPTVQEQKEPQTLQEAF